MSDNISPYSFFKQETDLATDYFFISEIRKCIYSLSFDTSENSTALFDNFNEYVPTIIENSHYLILIQKPYELNNNEVLKKEDKRIRATIIEIINHYLKSQNNNSFIVYECLKPRERLFNKWFSDFNQNYIKSGLEVEVGDKNMYFGYICKKANPKIAEVDKEIDRLSIFLLRKY